MLIAHPQTPSRLLDEIRNVAHRFHSTCHDDVRIAQQNFMTTKDDCFQSGTAGLVYSVRRDLLRNAGTIADLPRGVRTVAGASRMANDDFVDFGWLNLCAGQCFLHCDYAQICGAQWSQRSAESSYRGADSRSNEHRFHECDSTIILRCRPRACRFFLPWKLSGPFL